MKRRILKPKPCRNPKCGKTFQPFSSLEKFCSLTCAYAIVPKIIRRGQLERKRKERAEKRERVSRLEALKPLSKVIAETQREVNRYIRERDFALGCISCDVPASYDGQWTAGHFRTTAAAPHLRFNHDNLSKQCGQCNYFKSGNVPAFRLGLIARNGLARVEAIENDNTVKRWSRDELVEIRREHTKLWRALRAAREARAAA